MKSYVGALSLEPSDMSMLHNSCNLSLYIVLYYYIIITPLPTYLPRYLLHMKAGPTLPTSGDSNCFGSDPKLSKFFRSEALHRSSCVDLARCFQEILFTVLIGLDISKTLPRCNLQTYIEEPVFSCTFQEILFKQTGAFCSEQVSLLGRRPTQF